MKKIIMVLLVGLMVFGSFTTVFAEAPAENFEESGIFSSMEEKAGNRRYDILKEFTDEIHQINNIRIERHRLRIQVIEKQDQLLGLYIEARESGNKDALAAARKEREQIKSIHEDMKALHEKVQEAREGLRAAIKSNDLEAAGEYVDELLEVHSSINEKIKEKIEVLGAIMDILS